MHRQVSIGVLVVCLVMGAVAPPTLGAAAGIATPTVVPSTVDTGAETTVSFSTTIDSVDTGDGTTDATVEFALSGPVDLSTASVASASATPNATDVSVTVDDATDSVVVTWSDSGGIESETLSVTVTVDAVVLSRTGTVDVVARTDADANGGTDATSDSATLTAITPDADRSVTERPATLYLGERDVDITGVSGVNSAGDRQSFYGLGGAAEGRSATAADTRLVDVTAANRFAPGPYNFSSADGSVDVSVVRPRVTALTLFAGETASGAEVTNQSIPRDMETVTLEAAYNFDEAENLTVVVEDERGAGITPQLTDSPTVASSEDTLALDVSDLSVGRYEVTVEGSDDLSNASQTVSFRVRDPEKSVTLSKTRVVNGESTIATLAGAPGDIRYLRISGEALRSGRLVNPNTARDVFDKTSQVQSIGADSDANVLYAVVALDDDGISEVRIRTAPLATGAVDVELAPDFDAEREDDVTLDVRERTVSLERIPTSAIGETITVDGTAPESERVKLYARIDDTYRPLYADAASDDLAETTVDSKGAWDVEVDTAAVVNQAGAYRIVAVADPGATRLGSSEPLTDSTLRTLDPRGSTTLTTVEGSLSLQSSRTTIAATGSDEFTLSGVVTGHPDRVRRYHVGPRGAVDVSTLDVGDEGRFTETVDGVDQRGTHIYFVAAPGRDGSYAHLPDTEPAVSTLLSGGETQSQAVEVLVDAYEGPGSDDSVARVSVTGTDADLTVSSLPASDGVVSPAAQTLAGTASVEDGSTVFVELLGSDGRAVRVAEGTVVAGRWNATLDLRGVEDGSYRLSVETAGVTTSSPLTVSETSTTTAHASGDADAGGTAPDETATPDDSADETATPDEENVTDSPTTPTTTPTQLPGLGTVVTIVAFTVASLLVARRKQ